MHARGRTNRASKRARTGLPATGEGGSGGGGAPRTLALEAHFAVPFQKNSARPARVVRGNQQCQICCKQPSVGRSGARARCGRLGMHASLFKWACVGVPVANLELDQILPARDLGKEVMNGCGQNLVLQVVLRTVHECTAGE